MLNLQHTVATEPRHSTATVRRAGRVGRDAGYVLAMLGLSSAGFWVLGTCVLATAILLPTVVGALIGVASAFILRSLTGIDRRLAGWYLKRPIRARYRRPAAPGVVALVKTVGCDPRTWKDAGWVLGNSVVGLALGTGSLVITSLTIGYITTPVWWWAVPHPHDSYALLNLGIYTVTSTSLALITTVIGLGLAPLTIRLNRRIATVHANLARAALQD